MSASPNSQIVHLTDSQIGPYLALTPGHVVVKASIPRCPPCHMMRAIIRKLAVDFADRIRFVEIEDSEARGFCEAHNIDRFPCLLLFKDGQLAGRQVGFDYDETQQIVKALLGIDHNGDELAHEKAFRQAHAAAIELRGQIFNPAYEAVNPHFDEIAPTLDALQKQLDDEVTAGRITRADADKRLQSENDRLCAPFQGKLDAFFRAIDEGWKAYDSFMDEAICCYAAQDGEPTTFVAADTGQNADKVGCQPGSAFCSL
jgi:thioredoxin-like negative regulator of GroEL